MWNFIVIVSGLVLTVSAVTIGDPRNKSSLFPRSINGVAQQPRDGGGGIGNPADWSMSKANLVAEFYTNEPHPPQPQRSFSMLPPPPSGNRDRSNKSIFSFLRGGNDNNNDNQGGSNHPPPPPPGHSKHVNGNLNLVASATNNNFNQQALLYEQRNHINPSPGGYSTPFKPIKFPGPQRSSGGLVPPNKHDSGYLPGYRPPPPQFWDNKGPTQNNREYQNNNNIGLRPPSPGPLKQPPPLYLPPSQAQPQPQEPISRPAPPQPQYPPPQEPLQRPAPPQPQYPVPNNTSSTFIPSQQYPLQAQQFQPVPPHIVDAYRKQAVYPVYSGQTPGEKPMSYVTANSSYPSLPEQINQQQNNNNRPYSPEQYNQQENANNNGRLPSPTPPAFNIPPTDSFTNYENNPIPPPQIGQPNINTALSTESLSQVLAEANTKAGEAMDKTIRFVIHKPEDENIVKNAILEDAQNRYEDVRFVQGPTLKVQRKETVYLPPKKKTVVYILLKEPQIDTDVQVMAPNEEDPVPEVYITYQKSDGHVKTKHYSPKPIKEEDMKKYLDIEEEAYSSGQESQLNPKFSKSTSVSLSTSSTVSKKSASVSSSSKNHTDDSNSDLLRNHKMLSDENGIVDEPSSSAPNNTVLPVVSKSLSKNNSTLTSFHTYKKTRSPAATFVASPRRFPRYPIQCPTTVT